jgi:alkanesulfonate monooxygenase SsuD/methylene tetrahydromethanopterin reductase-like flavin-dependent oxidoreductase (luciferase family)
LEACDELGFDYSFCVEHHFRPDESWMSSPSLYAVEITVTVHLIGLSVCRRGLMTASI